MNPGGGTANTTSTVNNTMAEGGRKSSSSNLNDWSIPRKKRKQEEEKDSADAHHHHDDDDDRFSLSPPPNESISIRNIDNNNDDNDKEDFDTSGVIIPSATDQSTEDGNHPPHPVTNILQHDMPSSSPPPNHHPHIPYPSLRRAIVTNDGSSQNLIYLIGLKSLFAKQLPKMPKEYIARLVFDRNHISLALLSSDTSKCNTDEEIIGGICYRPYYDMKFAEIAFCAVSASQQVKGYGSKLMNLAKMHASTNGNIEYFITYADNYAIG
jgi:hypothetical protein